LIQFLDELTTHNNRDWFNNNKARYEAEVLSPCLEFIEAMQAPLARLSPHFMAVPKRTGGSLMRIYRDTRFAKDKTPYKTNVGIHFRHEKGKDMHTPIFYLHLSPEECFFGCGIWHPDAQTLRKIRKTINKDPAGWKRVSQGKPFLKQFELKGDSLKRPPQGFKAEHPLIDELKRKDFVGVTELDFDDVFDEQIIKTLTKRMKLAAPLVNYLCGAIGLKF